MSLYLQKLHFKCKTYHGSDPGVTADRPDWRAHCSGQALGSVVLSNVVGGCCLQARSTAKPATGQEDQVETSQVSPVAAVETRAA